MKTCNIDKTDRINRIVFGIILCIAALLHAAWYIYILIGIVLIVEGIIGWCGVPILMKKLKRS